MEGDDAEAAAPYDPKLVAEAAAAAPTVEAAGPPQPAGVPHGIPETSPAAVLKAPGQAHVQQRQGLQEQQQSPQEQQGPPEQHRPQDQPQHSAAAPAQPLQASGPVEIASDRGRGPRGQGGRGRGRGRAGGRGAARDSRDRDRARKFGFAATNLMVVMGDDERSDKALHAALHYRRRNDVLHVVSEIPLSGDKGVDEAKAQKGTEQLGRLREEMAARGIGRWETHLLATAHPDRELLDYAAKHHIKAIFLPDTGSPLGAHLVQRAQCSLMLVR